MALDQRDHSIIAQVAVKGAVELLAHRPDLGGDLHTHAETISNEIYSQIQSRTQSDSVETIQQTFPGAQVVQGPAPSGPPPAAPAPAPAPAAGPAPIPNAEPSVEDLWRDLFENFDQWWDNREDKRNSKAPDFKHKTKKGDNGYNLGLWVNSKDTPDWVKERLGVS